MLSKIRLELQIEYNSQAFGFFYKNFNLPDSQIRASAENIKKLNKVREICNDKGLTPQQVIYGFFAGLDITTVPISTTSSSVHLAEMLESCDVCLDSDEVSQLLL